METRPEHRFTTLDVYLAAFLTMRGFTLSLHKSGGKVIFSFAPSPHLNNLIGEFNSNTMIGAADFTTAVKRLRGMMLQTRDANNIQYAR